MKNIAWAGVVLGLSFVFLPAQVCAGETIEQLRVSGARVVTDPKTSIARFIGFDAHGVVDRVALAGAAANAARQQMPAEATAAQHLSTYAALFGLRDASSETRPMRQRISRDGRSMNRYQQLHLGVPIIAGELIVNQTAERQLTSISGKISPELKIDVTPVISAVRAGEIARQAMAKWYQLPEADFVVPDPILSIYDSRLISPHEDPIVLVWRIEVSTRSLRPINEFIAVDAITGVIPVHFNQVPHAKNRITYDANNMTSLPGVIACDESNPTCAGKIQDAISAHRYVGKTYDFYMSNFGRDGIDGAGLTMISSVRVCGTTACPLTPYANAAWTGTQMIYGANLSQAEDVVAHELTHGVTQFESGLFYYYQSGAINESLSDIFGEFVQQGDPDGTVTAATKWQIAEDLAPFGFSWGGYLRSMANPLLKDQPDKMTSSKYFTGITNLLTPSSQRPGDNGGVHINSGVGNKAAYLMTDGSVNESGGQFNGRVVVGLGLTKVANIFYEVQTNLLTSGADYLDLYNALYQACQNLVGQSGIAASDCQQVRNATEAVEMQLQPLAGYNPEAAVCSAGQIARSLYPKNYNGFELSTDFSGVPGWTRQLDFAREGTFSLFGKGSGSFLIDQSVQFTEAVTLPPNAYLRFEHAFEFEATGTTFYDGGAVGYRVNGGPFTPLASPTDGAGYTGVISSLGGNPLAGKSAFSGSSHGYVSTRFDLSSLAGSSVNLGWRIGTDSTVQSKGWWLDNLQLYTCQPGFVLSYSKTGSGSGSVTSSPEGINACSLPCNSGYESGAIVTLTATSASRSRFLGWSGACTGIGTCVVTMDGAKNVTANFTFSPLPDDGFPGSTNLPAGWTQPSGSNATWFATNTAAFAGAQSLRSGVIGNNQNSDISFVGNFAAGNISFARKVSSEQGYDFLVFYVDGVLKAQWSGESDWIEVSFPIAAGAHTFLWRYIKDSILSSGSDAAWIDAVVLPLQLSVSTTSLGSSLNPSVFGQAVSITATVSGSLVTPIGTVAFVDGPNVIAGCASVPVTNGVAQCVTTSLSNGVHSITGQYSGNTTYGSSTSSVLTQTVIGVFPLIPLFMLLL